MSGSAGDASPSRLARADSWLAFLSIVIAVVGMFAGTARLAGADESVHLSTAWFVAQHGLTPPTIVKVDVPIPGALVNAADVGSGPQVFSLCFTFKREVSAACLPPRASLVEWTGYRVMNYPPPYYAVAGLGERLASAVLAGWEDLGARVASMLLSLGVLLALGLHMRRRYPLWATYLLALTTPMVAFYWAVVNPSGWEITMALAFAYASAHLWWARSHRPRQLTARPIVLFALVSVAFAMARPVSIVWMGLLVVCVVLMARTDLVRRSQLWLAGVLVGAGLISVAWAATHRAITGTLNPLPISNPTLADYANWFVNSLALTPSRLAQMVGDLGWLDTQTPRFLVVSYGVCWLIVVAVLVRRGGVRWGVLAVALVGGVVVPSLLEAALWRDWPGWWQGRYTLPFVVGFLLLLMMKGGHRAPRAVSLMSLATTLLLVIMVAVNAARYAFGIEYRQLAGIIDFYIPVQLQQSGIGTRALGIALLCAAALLVVGGLRLPNALRLSPPPREAALADSAPPVRQQSESA